MNTDWPLIFIVLVTLSIGAWIAWSSENPMLVRVCGLIIMAIAATVMGFIAYFTYLESYLYLGGA